jgi:hypothetical protein
MQRLLPITGHVQFNGERRLPQGFGDHHDVSRVILDE